MQCAVGQQACLLEQVRRRAGLDGTLGEGQLHLDGGQHLADFVVQFPRDRPPLVLLGAEQLRGKPLQRVRRGDFGLPLPLNALLEASRVHHCQQRDAKAGDDRQAEALPQTALRHSVHCPDCGVLFHESVSVQRLDLLGHSHHALALGHDPLTEQHGRLGGPAAAVGRQDVEEGAAKLTDVVPQARDAISLGTGVGDRRVLLQRLVGRAICVLELAAVLGCVCRIRIEQRVADEHGSHQHLVADGREQVLSRGIANVDRGRPRLQLCHALHEVVPREQPNRENQAESE